METQSVAIDVSRMTKTQKLAALLVVLGPESAAQMLKSFDQEEIEAISLEMSRLHAIPREAQNAILDEFTEVAAEAIPELT